MPTTCAITPEAKTALRVIDDKLCVSGLAYGENYRVRLRTGFPGRDGVKLAEEEGRRRGAGRPSRRRHPARQGLHPAARQRRRPASHHHQRLQGRPRRLSRERARHQGFARDRYDATFPGSEPVTETWSLDNWLNGANGERQWRGTMEVRNVPNQPVTTAFPIRETSRTGSPAPTSSWPGTPPQPAGADSDDEEEDQGGKRRRRHVGDGHRHRAHHLHRRRRAQRLRPLAADRPAAGRPRSRAAVARQRADRPRR